MARTLAERVKRHREGLCSFCGKQAVEGMSACPHHQVDQRKWGDTRRRSLGIPQRLSCLCGVPGHYAKTCPLGERPEVRAL